MQDEGGHKVWQLCDPAKYVTPHLPFRLKYIQRVANLASWSPYSVKTHYYHCQSFGCGFSAPRHKVSYHWQRIKQSQAWHDCMICNVWKLYTQWRLSFSLNWVHFWVFWALVSLYFTAKINNKVHLILHNFFLRPMHYALSTHFPCVPRGWQNRKNWHPLRIFSTKPSTTPSPPPPSIYGNFPSRGFLFRTSTIHVTTSNRVTTSQALSWDYLRVITSWYTPL